MSRARLGDLPDKTSAAKEYCPKDRERGHEAMQGNDQWSALIDPVGSLQQIMTIESGRGAAIESFSHSFEFIDLPELLCGLRLASRR